MRSVIEDDSFKRQVDDLGGARKIDPALGSIMDGLMSNPEGFDRFDGGDFSFRYAKTHPVGDLPAFTVIFTLDRDGNVYLKQIEEDVPF